MRSFLTYGKLGDVIFELPAVRAMGGGKVVLLRRDWISEEGASELSRLIFQCAPYVKDWSRGDSADVDLGAHAGIRFPASANIARLTLRALSLDEKEADRQWLFVDPDGRAYGRVAFARNLIYDTKPGFYEPLLSEHRDRAFFVGLAAEHAAFEERYGPIDWFQTPMLLDAARLIAGADLFVGNQSCLHAIAEALKKPLICGTREGDEKAVLFERPGARYFP